jgi:ribosome-binding protein aMBF1 (putative translation factor)
MSLADRLAQQLSDNNPEFKEVWEDQERQQQFDLSCRLVELRKEMGMTQQELATKLEMKQSYVSRLENGQVNITLGKLQEIAHRLGARVHVSIDFDQDETSGELLTK